MDAILPQAELCKACGCVSAPLFPSRGRPRAPLTHSLQQPTLRILANANWTRQISRLHRRPYSPQSLSSESRRSFSYGRLGVLKVFRSARADRNEHRRRQSKANR